MNEIKKARLILYSGDESWVTRTLESSLKDGVFNLLGERKITILEISVVEAAKLIEKANLPDFPVEKDGEVLPYIRNPEVLRPQGTPETFGETSRNFLGNRKKKGGSA